MAKKIKMREVQGEKGSYHDSVEGKSKPKKILPKVTFHDTELPEIDDWEVGKKYTIVTEVELVAVRKGNEYDFEKDDKRTRGTFKIHSVGVEEPEEEDFQTTYGKTRAAAHARQQG